VIKERRMPQSLAVRARAARQSSERPAPPLDTPRLLRSSEELGWEGFTVRTFDEPPVMEHWRAPDSPALTLVMVTQGVMQVEQRRLDGPWEAHTLHPGDLFLRPPGRAPYELRWWAGSQAPMRTVHLQVQPAVVRQSAAALQRGDLTRCAPIERVGLRDPLLAQLCATLARMLAHGTPAEGLAAQTAVQLVLAHLLRHHSVRGAPADQPQRLSAPQLQRVVDYIQAHLAQPLTLEALATQAGYSPYHFARLFRAATGESPYQFVLRQRVEGAQQLLREGQLPLLGVALACGFASQSHMTRHFRQQLGVTPGAYQRLLGVPPPPVVDR
jgi:AraC family transcriptional regulator